MWLWVGLLSLFTSFCLISFLYEAATTYFRYHNGLIVLGAVQDVRDESNTDTDWTSYDVSFKSADGQIYNITNHYNTTDSPHIYQVGQPIKVVYDPKNPDDGRIDSNREKYGVVTGTLLLAAIGISVSTFSYFGIRRSRLSAVPNSIEGEA